MGEAEGGSVVRYRPQHLGASRARGFSKGLALACAAGAGRRGARAFMQAAEVEAAAARGAIESWVAAEGASPKRAEHAEWPLTAAAKQPGGF